jgi:mono/diheme cytochrome c family protein
MHFPRRILRPLGLCVCLAALLIAGGCSEPDGNIAEGKRWYRMHNCSACHGDNGYDGNAPNIAALDMRFNSFTHRLRNTKTAVMPEYDENRISDNDAADILAYLKSITVP